MSSLVKQNGGFVETATMTSLELRELINLARKDFDEPEVENRHFLARVEDELGEDLPSVKTLRSIRGGHPIKYYDLTLDQCLLVGMRESKAVRRTVLTKIKELESQVASEGSAIAVPQTLSEALRLAADLAEQKQIAESERDEAVRTKAQIGSRREATAMAKASAVVRKVNKLEHELGRNQHHATVTAVERVAGEKFPRNAYVALRRWCKKHNSKAVDVVDERYGTVKAWPAGAWLSEFDVNLTALFGAVPNGGGGKSSHGGLA